MSPTWSSPLYERVADLVYVQLPRQSDGHADLVRIAPGQELRGVTVPLHPGAVR